MDAQIRDVSRAVPDLTDRNGVRKHRAGVRTSTRRLYLSPQHGVAVGDAVFFDGTAVMPVSRSDVRPAIMVQGNGRFAPYQGMVF